MKNIHTVITDNDIREIYLDGAATLSFSSMKVAERWAKKIEKKLGIKCTPAYKGALIGNYYYLIASAYIAKGTLV